MSVARIQTITNEMSIKGNNTSGLGGAPPAGDGKDDKDKKV